MPLSKLKRALSFPLLVATDFDGTLAPIVEDPGSARALPESVALLHRLAKIPGVSLAVISGRSLESMEELCRDFPSHWRAGEHGNALQGPDGVELRGPVVDTRELDALQARAESLQQAFPGLGVERKRRSVALHTRNLVERRDEGIAAIDDWCRQALLAGLSLNPGREVMEMQLPGGGKSQALESLRELVGAACVVYAGDDVTDLDALQRLGSRADSLAIWVDSPERERPGFFVDAHVQGPEGWCGFLSELVNALEAMS